MKPSRETVYEIHRSLEKKHRLFWGGWFHTFNPTEAQWLSEHTETHVIASVAYVYDQVTGVEQMQFCMRPRKWNEYDDDNE